MTAGRLVHDYHDFFPVTLQQGRNVLLVAVGTESRGEYAFFGFEPGTEYTVSMGVGYTFSPTPIHLGDTFTLDIHAENISTCQAGSLILPLTPLRLKRLT